MRHFEHQVIDVQLIEEAVSARHSPFCNGLSAVVAEAEMHGALAVEGVEHAVDGGGRQRARRRDCRGCWPHPLAGSRTAGRRPAAPRTSAIAISESLEIAVVVIQQRARQHVRAGDGELERPAGNAGGEFAIGEES